MAGRARRPATSVSTRRSSCPSLQATTGLVATVFAFLIIPVWAFYLLKDRPSLVRSFEASIPPEWRPDIQAVVAIVGRVFGSWIRGQVLLGVAVGMATFLGLLLLGAAVNPIFSRFAVLLAVIAGLLELLPIIGPIIAAVPAILIAATAGFEAAGAAFLLYLAVQQVENNLLVPKIQGRGHAAPPERRHARARGRRCRGRAPRRDPGPAGHRRQPGRLPPPVRATERAGGT